MLIYGAAPQFSFAERRFNAELIDRLGAAGFDVFLPQSDSAERDRLPHDAMPPEARRTAMFELDVAKVIACDVLEIVLDGRVPDEGACIELGVAYVCKRHGQSGKRWVGLQTDVRGAFLGAKRNPLLAVALDDLVADETALMDTLAKATVSDGQMRRS